jgi:isopenicillin N synthase-like dioxygenase
MSDAGIPVIDLAPYFRGGDAEKRRVAGQIDEACTDVGFFTVVGHGVPEEQIRTVRQATVDFFALPLEEKLKVERPPEKISRGYNCLFDRALSYGIGKATPPDIQEAYAFGPELNAEAGLDDRFASRMLAPNRWPDRPAGFKPLMLAYADAMTRLRVDLMRIMAVALRTDEDYFTEKFERSATVTRLVRYPAVTDMPQPGQLRAGDHTDYGVVTFVRGDDTPGGLQVKHRNGGWIDVHPVPGSFVCNLGDMMMRWTNDHWVSTLHRVAVPPPDAVPQDRISLVSFQQPNPNAVIRCIESCLGADGTAKYPPITSGQYYLDKLMKAGHSRLDASATDALVDG